MAGVATILLMGTVMITGNYCFFNILTCALAIITFSNSQWLRYKNTVLGKVITQLTHTQLNSNANNESKKMSVKGLVSGVAIVLITMGLCGDLSRFIHPTSHQWVTEKLINYVRGFRLINSYGLFAVMTTQRESVRFGQVLMVNLGSHMNLNINKYN